MKAFLFFIVFFYCSNSFGQVPADQFNNSISRQIALAPKNNSIYFSYVYKNGVAYGTSCTLTYNDFYKTYTISFFKQDGYKTSCQIKDSNFISVWDFKYNGNKYSLTNSKK